MEKETIPEELKLTPPQAPQPQNPGQLVEREISGIRTASQEQFEKANRKTSEVHAGLFRRLAK